MTKDSIDGQNQWVNKISAQFFKMLFVRTSQWQVWWLVTKKMLTDQTSWSKKNVDDSSRFLPKLFLVIALTDLQWSLNFIMLVYFQGFLVRNPIFGALKSLNVIKVDILDSQNHLEKCPQFCPKLLFNLTWHFLQLRCQNN